MRNQYRGGKPQELIVWPVDLSCNGEKLENMSEVRNEEKRLGSV